MSKVQGKTEHKSEIYARYFERTVQVLNARALQNLGVEGEIHQKSQYKQEYTKIENKSRKQNTCHKIEASIDASI
ncbi:MAG: hypothetical protein KC736_02540 [Candidatus Moranbacteria bacterium]|nr:hypothetical protein [Candidatus Moranbacteria bacterium]